MSWINEASQAEQIAYVSDDGFSIEEINNPSEAVQLAAINNYAGAIGNIENPTDKAKMAAIEKDPASIQFFVEECTEAMLLQAIRGYGLAIRHIEKPTYEMKVVALKKDLFAALYIKDVSIDMLDESFNINFQDKLGHTLLHLAVGQNNESVVRFCLSLKPNTNIKNRRAETALEIANVRGLTEIGHMIEGYIAESEKDASDERGFEISDAFKGR